MNRNTDQIRRPFVSYKQIDSIEAFRRDTAPELGGSDLCEITVCIPDAACDLSDGAYQPVYAVRVGGPCGTIEAVCELVAELARRIQADSPALQGLAGSRVRRARSDVLAVRSGPDRRIHARNGQPAGW